MFPSSPLNFCQTRLIRLWHCPRSWSYCTPQKLNPLPSIAAALRSANMIITPLCLYVYMRILLVSSLFGP